MPPEVIIGDRSVRIEPFSGRKATRVLRLLSDISKQTPELLRLRAEFRTTYAQENVLELTRAEAHARFGDRLQHMTAEDWQQSGELLRIRQLPSLEEELIALFPEALDRAEGLVVQLLALIAMPNDEVKRHARSGALNGPEGELAQQGDDLLDAPAEQLLELAIVAGETVDQQFQRKLAEAGDRLGNALRLFGIGRTPQEPTPTTTSATPSPTPTSSGATPEPASDLEPTRSIPATEPSPALAS